MKGEWRLEAGIPRTKESKSLVLYFSKCSLGNWLEMKFFDPHCRPPESQTLRTVALRSVLTSPPDESNSLRSLRTSGVTSKCQHNWAGMHNSKEETFATGSLGRSKPARRDSRSAQASPTVGCYSEDLMVGSGGTNPSDTLSFTFRWDA